MRLAVGVAGIDQRAALLADHHAAQFARLIDRELDLEARFHDVDDPVDQQSHGVLTVVKDQDLLPAVGLKLLVLRHPDQRHQLAAILKHELIVRGLDLLGIDFLQPGHELQGHDLRFRAICLED